MDHQKETKNVNIADRYVIDDLPVYDALRTSVIDQIVKHSSVRSFDTSRQLPEGIIDTVVTAAQSASTSSNLQTWSVIAVQDEQRKKQLSAYSGHQSSIVEAPLFMVFCADISRLKALTSQRDYPFKANQMDMLLIAAIDSALACQNASLAVESLGMGCCMIGGIRNNPREVAELLNLPLGVFATIGLVIGYPAKTNPVKPRLPQHVVLHNEQYSTETLEEGIAQYDAKMAQTNIYSGRRVEVPGLTPKPEEDTELYSWSEHTARRMARSNEQRRGLAQFIREQGFSLD